MLLIVIAGGGIFGILQLDTSRNYIAAQIEEEFNNQYKGELSIGGLQGLMPFRFELNDVTLTAASPQDSLETDSVIMLERLEAQIDLWSLLQNKLSIIDFKVENPLVRFISDGDGGYSLVRAFQPVTPEAAGRQAPQQRWIEKIEIVAPVLTVRNGSLYIEKFYGIGDDVHFPEPFTANSINTTMFLEVSEIQRFLDIEHFSANLDDLKIQNIFFSGQIYNNRQVLEFNAFHITTSGSELTVSGQMEGVDLEAGSFKEQLPSAHYDLDIHSNKIKLSEFSDLIPKIPHIEEPLDFSIVAEGTVDSLRVDAFSLGAGESYVSIDGLIQNLIEKDRLNYQFKVRNVFLRKRDIEIFTGALNQEQYKIFENLRFNGAAGGSADSVSVDLNLESPNGTMALKGYTRLAGPLHYSASLTGNEVNFAPFSGGRIDTTSLNFDAIFNGIGHNLKQDVHNITISVYNSSVENVGIDQLKLNASLIDGFLEHRYVYQTNNEQISGNGWLDLDKEEPVLVLQGKAANLDLSGYFTSGNIPQTRLNVDFNVELQGLQSDRVRGRANLDVNGSVIDGDTVRAHQIYMDLDSPDLDKRTFRLTSTLFDLNVRGDLKPSNIISQASYWSRYLKERIDEELLLETANNREPVASRPEPLALEGNFITKDLTLIRQYWKGFPQLIFDTRLNFDLRADPDRLLLTVDSRIDTLVYKETEMQNATARLTASFRHDRLLKEFANIEFETEIDSVHTGFADFDSVGLDFSLRQDSLFLTQRIGRISKDARSQLKLSGKISPSMLTVNIENFFLGNEQYAWQNEAGPTLTFRQNSEIQFDDFRFKNNKEYLAIRGNISQNRKDSVLFVLRDVNLQRISELVNGRVSFSGILNGTLTGRSLIERPSLQGQLNVQHLTMDNRLIGDATFESRFNPDKDRFDTQITVVTDSTKYANYLTENDNTGQRIYLNGYFVPPNPDAPGDTVFYFDANFSEIDLWIVPNIVPKVFREVEGRATGGGYITGNLEDYDFHFDFQVQNAFAKPHFLNTNYFVNGHIVFDRQDWVVLNSLNVADTKGGTGLVYGNVDLNNFSPITNLNLTWELQDLHFLNNSYNPDVPFYGSISGTGTVRLTGPNNDMFLSTQNPVLVTSDSKLSIPLLEETELNQNTKFIRFVDKFDPSQSAPVSTRAEEKQPDRDFLNRMLENLTFSERFNLDLQFNANNPMTVELIFDQVTGEVLTARGTGQLRLTMEEGQVQMFGRYNIADGRYLFVGGEIFTRPLELEEGGSIIWEGVPDNARLNINAIYHARSSMAPLMAGQAASTAELEGQRVPVDLVVEITGTIGSVVNNYYFRIPNTLEISSNAALTARINELNRDEQQKLIQATSILLTGNFITYQDVNEASLNIGQSFTKRSTYLNPLLSSQVISPLLSNQINALLNSDVSRLDIDFNLNTYNEIDLGVALRLYNDRLILRREGLITGTDEQTSLIGDLNATYRINRSLSVMAFHRQDRSLSSVTQTTTADGVAATVDGIGLEAQVKFNTWKDFTRKIKNTILEIFGAGKKDEEEKNEKLASDGSANEEKN